MANIAGTADNALLLQDCPLFSGLEKADLEVLGRRAYRHSLRAGELVFGYGDPGESMMIVLLGTIRISRPTTQDKELILGDLAVGDILGEMAVLDGRPRSAEARAVTNSSLLVLERRDLVPFLEAHPRVCMSLLTVLCTKIRLSDERTSDVLSSLSSRLAKTIVRRVTPGKTMKLSLSQGELADMVGSTRESVNRQLGAWRDEGFIKLQDGWVIVVDLDALTKRAGVSSL